MSTGAVAVAVATADVVNGAVLVTVLEATGLATLASKGSGAGVDTGALVTGASTCATVITFSEEADLV
ncbi:hypothetical protein GCM10023183_16240 [Nibribacter koreensis]|uniref:Secreted protein n=1 Tax=Nibribacter koreensis TaxID=1084519 RepID=A0ABP8FGV7_9BACT